MPWPNTWIFWNQTEQWYMLTGELTCLYEIQNQHRTHKHKIKKMFFKFPCMSQYIKNVYYSLYGNTCIT